MKTIFLISRMGILLIFAVLFSQNVLAQKPQSQQAKAETPNCDQVLPTVKKEAQEKANQTCATVTTCTECIDKATKIKLNAVQVIQPECENTAQVDELVPEKKVAPLKRRFNFELLQSPCTDKGTSLSVFIPGKIDANRDGNFAYLWEVDGKKAGHESAVQCACGESASVRVTNLDTGQSFTKNVKLRGCQTSRD